MSGMCQELWSSWVSYSCSGNVRRNGCTWVIWTRCVFADSGTFSRFPPCVCAISEKYLRIQWTFIDSDIWSEWIRSVWRANKNNSRENTDCIVGLIYFGWGKGDGGHGRPSRVGVAFNLCCLHCAFGLSTLPRQTSKILGSPRDRSKFLAQIYMYNRFLFLSLYHFLVHGTPHNPLAFNCLVSSFSLFVSFTN